MSGLYFALHGVTLALVWFAIANAIATAAVVLVARRATARSHARVAWFWLALRLFPATASALLVAVVFVPSYWMFEPRDYAEGFQGALAIIALLALALVAAAFARAAAAFTRASARAQRWMAVAQPIALPGASMPAFCVNVDAPVLALVGVVQPRLFISRRVLSMLNEEELRAAVAHETGHRRAWDNLKRLALCATADFLATTRIARDLEQRWASTAEHDADRTAYASAEGEAGTGARCALASAIVKVARLIPPGTSQPEPISTLVDGSDIESRVRSLLDGNPGREEPRAPRRARAATTVALAAFTLAAAYMPLLRAAHEATEMLVHWLP